MKIDQNRQNRPKSIKLWHCLYIHTQHYAVLVTSQNRPKSTKIGQNRPKSVKIGHFWPFLADFGSVWDRNRPDADPYNPLKGILGGRDPVTPPRAHFRGPPKPSKTAIFGPKSVIFGHFWVDFKTWPCVCRANFSCTSNLHIFVKNRSNFDQKLIKTGKMSIFGYQVHVHKYDVYVTTPLYWGLNRYMINRLWDTCIRLCTGTKVPKIDQKRMSWRCPLTSFLTFWCKSGVHHFAQNDEKWQKWQKWWKWGHILKHVNGQHM